MSRLTDWLVRWWPGRRSRPASAPESVPFTDTGKVALSARALVRGFGSGSTRRIVVRDVGLDLELGQFCLLMGPAGSGKSTLLAMLSGLLQPEEGFVRGLGHDLWAMSSREREAFRREHCGFVFQGSNLLPALSARKQLELVLRWGMGVGRRDAALRAAELLKTLGMEKKMDLLPAALSGGEKQRVAIARALIKKPRLLFADEPTSALDWEENGRKVARLLHDAAHRYGAMVLVVSHDPRLLPFADRVFHMDDGVLAEAEKPDGPALNGSTSRGRRGADAAIA